MRTLVTVVATLLSAVPASACPLCESATGRRVRAGVSGEQFVHHLAAAALPFAVLLGGVALIHVGWPDRPPQATEPEA